MYFLAQGLSTAKEFNHIFNWRHKPLEFLVDRKSKDLEGGEKRGFESGTERRNKKQEQQFDEFHAQMFALIFFVLVWRCFALAMRNSFKTFCSLERSYRQ